MHAGPAQVTHLFRDMLHGWGSVLLAVCASPAARDYDETVRVLRYASLASQIGTAARAEPPLRALKCAALSSMPEPLLQRWLRSRARRHVCRRGRSHPVI